MTTKQTKTLATRQYKFETPKNLSGLSRTHRLIMIEKHKEIQFMMLCEKIRLEDYKKNRADQQRDNRREKRCKKVTMD